MLDVFVSYTGDDAPAVESLMRELGGSGLRMLPREESVGGERWWAAVLDHIRTCDVFVFLVSDSAFRSKRCHAEVDYARALGVPTLPVQIGEVGSYSIGPLFDIPLVDYRNPDASAGMGLMVALHQQAAARTELPDPLPEPPPYPYESLQRLDTPIGSPGELSAGEQRAMVHELAEELAAGDGDVRSEILRLLRELRHRPDVAHATVSAIDSLVASTAAAPAPQRARDVVSESARVEPVGAADSVSSSASEPTLALHEEVAFTVYRPRVIRPVEWAPLLAFAHLGEPPLGADPADDPIRQVEEQARAILGDSLRNYKRINHDSLAAVPEEAEITFLLDVEGCRVDAPYQKFLWTNAFQMVKFQIQAHPGLDGTVTRGRLAIHHGLILLAELPLSIRVDAAPRDVRLDDIPLTVTPYHKIFPSYSHEDTMVVEQVTQFVESLGHHYLQDVRELRSGEIWDERLRDFIREADVFQLFWSTNAMGSEFVEQEWRYAIGLGRPNFIRPTYWEEPMPKAAGLPPPELGKIHFYPLGKAVVVAQQPGATGRSVLATAAYAPASRGRSSPGGEPSTAWPDLPRRGGWLESASASPTGPVGAPPPVWGSQPTSAPSMDAHPASTSRRRPLVWAGAAAGLLLAAPLVAVMVLANGGQPKPASPPAPASSEQMTTSLTPPTTTRLTTSTTVAPTPPLPSGARPTPVSPVPTP